MGLLPTPAEKYDFSRIGDASAAAVMGLLLANSSTSFLAVGFTGKILFKIISYLFSGLASSGLVLLNVGAEQINSILLKSEFDGSLESAYKAISNLESQGHKLSKEEIEKIDGPVIESFKKFAKLSRK